MSVKEGYYGSKDDYYDSHGHCYNDFFYDELLFKIYKKKNEDIKSEFSISNEKSDNIKISIKKYFKENGNQELDDDEIAMMVDFFMENLATEFYNQGIIDSYKFITDKVDALLEMQK